MALIYCPECNKKISDKANNCPNCGFPMFEFVSKNNIENSLYNIILINTGVYGNKINVINSIEKVLNINFNEASDFAINIPSIIKKNISLSEANNIKQRLEFAGAEIALEPYNREQNDNILLKKYKSNVIACPRCGSTAITTGQRGFSIVTGFLGSNKTVNRCGKCGYSWQPK